MKIDPESKVAVMGVREMAEFEICRRAAGRPSGQWRMETGRAWHQTIQKENSSDFSYEQPIKGEVYRLGWTVRLEGRCDLFRASADGTPVFGEIKTVTDPLPLPVTELRARFPAYFRQLASYLLISGNTERINDSFLLFLNIDSGIRQTVPAEASDLENLEQHISALIEFLEFTSQRSSQRASLTWQSFRDHPREGQIEASDQLSAAEKTHQIVGFQAPTGFGKTRIVLEHALEAMQAGKAERILYLTGKTSGQEQACVEASHLFPEGNGLRSYRMRNHREHWAVCPLDGCLSNQCAPPSDERSSFPLTSLTDHPGHAALAWETVQSLAQGYHFCPYSISRGMLPFSDLWIADYNYIFSPSSSHVFREQPGFDPARTWLLIDEAHNLPERAASALGGSLEERLLDNAAEDLRAFHGASALSGILRELAREIRSLPPDRVVDPNESYLFANLFEAGSDALSTAPLDWRQLPAETVMTLQAIDSAIFLLQRDDLHPILWSPAPGRLEWLPLQVGPWISESLAGFAQTVFFSATLDPFSSFVAGFGLEESQCQLVRTSTTGPQRFRTLIDARVRTTRKERSRNAAKTAETIQDLAEATRSCVAAFFPSYEYAESIRTYLEAIAPHLRSAIQPRDLNAEEREYFARSAPLSHDVLFLMLGGSFAEAVDSFGGIIETALIAGPGLPELSTLNRTRMEGYPDRETGFHEVCRIPGMRRVNQAIGRLVRSLDHRATIVLHDSRFLEEEYRQLLRDDLGEVQTVRRDSEWREWVGKP